VKKALAILSLSIYLFGATEAYQLLKLPLFIKHYIIHKSANKHISIAGFIKIHESVSCTITAISLPTERMVIDIPFTASLPARNFFFKEVNYSFDHLPTIFQPPRIV
jgi:hypothetical protein